MSVDTWKEEFWKYDATSMEAALDSAILKWKGLSPKNLKKHNLIHEFESELYDNENGSFVANQCALCEASRNITPKGEHPCDYCILKYCVDEWTAWTDGNDPKPMQKLLAKIKGGQS